MDIDLSDLPEVSADEYTKAIVRIDLQSVAKKNFKSYFRFG